jgi:large subunit ribosomal protein L10
MKREDKNTVIDSLTEKLKSFNHFYLTDISELNAVETNALRRKCFEKDINLIVVKNTLLRKALEKLDGDFSELNNVLKNSTSIMFSDTGNIPAKLIAEFRKKHDKPILKAAYVEQSIYIGDKNLEVLSMLKSREELIENIIRLLRSPVINVLSALQSGNNILSGVVKTLSQKE